MRNETTIARSLRKLGVFIFEINETLSFEWMEITSSFPTEEPVPKMVRSHSERISSFYAFFRVDVLGIVKQPVVFFFLIRFGNES